MMVPTKTRWKVFRSSGRPSDLLESHYAQLLQWAVLLTRGDANLAREIVHELCVHLMLTQVDFGRIANVDGYLYTSLRHVYLSRMSKASREALRFLSVSDFDSVQFAVQGNERSGSLSIQNELRAICSYAVWRKDASKSFSYFVLHFFMGYFPREIGQIAVLPVSAVYNKLKSARSELKSHLVKPGKVQPIKLSDISLPQEAVVAVGAMELFSELRAIIHAGRKGECLSEADLLQWYATNASTPVPCELLSHVVSCERCLTLIDRHSHRPTLIDRDPFDGFDRGLNMQDLATPTTSYTLRDAVRRQKERVYNHRPQAIFIAVNGRVIAFHDVQGVQSTLSIRVGHSEQPGFVEVFSEQQVRLAMISIDNEPPMGLPSLSQTAFLSEGRRLDLRLSFDGLGLHGEAVYFDPAASPLDASTAEETSHQEADRLAGFPAASWIKQLLQTLFPAPAVAWGLATALLVAMGWYAVHPPHHATLNAAALLDDAVQVETNDMVGATKHQTLALSEFDAQGMQFDGLVELWQEDQTGRTMRRLYDTKHHLLASEWTDEHGTSESHVEPTTQGVDESARQLVSNDLWKQDVSPRHFRRWTEKTIQASTTDNGYRLVASVDTAQPVDVAVLVLDRSLHVVSEELRLRNGSSIRRVTFVSSKQEFQPSSKVSSKVFIDQSSQKHSSATEGHLPQNKPGSQPQLVQLQIAVLYELSKLGADVGEPLDVARSADGRIVVSGALSHDAPKAEILKRLKTLPYQQLLTIQLNSQGNSHLRMSHVAKSTAPYSSVYSVTRSEAPADVLLKKHFAALGKKGDEETIAISQFSRQVLDHSQHALQHAYALDRLRRSFTMDELQSAGSLYQQQWADMATTHALELQTQLRALQSQLNELGSGGPVSSPSDVSININNPAMFASTVAALLHKTQELNRTVGLAFTSGASKGPDQDVDHLLTDATASVPLAEAAEIAYFTQRLSHGNVARTKRDEQSSPLRPHGNP